MLITIENEMKQKGKVALFFYCWNFFLLFFVREGEKNHDEVLTIAAIVHKRNCMHV